MEKRTWYGRLRALHSKNQFQMWMKREGVKKSEILQMSYLEVRLEFRWRLWAPIGRTGGRGFNSHLGCHPFFCLISIHKDNFTWPVGQVALALLHPGL